MVCVYLVSMCMPGTVWDMEVGRQRERKLAVNDVRVCVYVGEGGREGGGRGNNLL